MHAYLHTCKAGACMSATRRSMTMGRRQRWRGTRGRTARFEDYLDICSHGSRPNLVPSMTLPCHACAMTGRFIVPSASYLYGCIDRIEIDRRSIWRHAHKVACIVFGWGFCAPSLATACRADADDSMHGPQHTPSLHPNTRTRIPQNLEEFP
jgi:hypothetical protein